jgi:hypothetical protein
MSSIISLMKIMTELLWPWLLMTVGAAPFIVTAILDFFLQPMMNESIA